MQVLNESLGGLAWDLRQPRASVNQGDICKEARESLGSLGKRFWEKQQWMGREMHGAAWGACGTVRGMGQDLRVGPRGLLGWSRGWTQEWGKQRVRAWTRPCGLGWSSLRPLRSLLWPPATVYSPCTSSAHLSNRVDDKPRTPEDEENIIPEKNDDFKLRQSKASEDIENFLKWERKRRWQL